MMKYFRSLFETELIKSMLQYRKIFLERIANADKGLMYGLAMLFLFIAVSYIPAIKEWSISCIMNLIAQKETTNAAIIAFLAALIAHSASTKEVRRQNRIGIQSSRMTISILLPILSDFCKESVRYIHTSEPLIKKIQAREPEVLGKKIAGEFSKPAPVLSQEAISLLNVAIACPVESVSCHIANLVADLKVMESRMKEYEDIRSSDPSFTQILDSSYDCEIINIGICKRNVDVLFGFARGEDFNEKFPLGVENSLCSLLSNPSMVARRDKLIEMANRMDKKLLRYVCIKPTF